MPVSTKSVYDPEATDDGLRVLITQYWPRGVRKDRVDQYLRLLGPSRDLLHAFRNGDIAWDAFAEGYLRDVKNPRADEEIARLAGIARDETVTLMCVCRDERECHRRLLKDLIEARLQ